MEAFTSQDLAWILPLLIWDLAWKGFALWRAARNRQPVWFLFLLILNTAGILPIIYLLISRKPNQPAR